MSFRDEQNLPLQNVSVTDLEGKIHGRSVKIVSLAPDPRAHRVVVILDMSASMGLISVGSPLWGLEFSLARHFYKVNREKVKIALLFFNNRITEVIDFAQGNSAVGDKLQRIAEDHEYIKTHIKGTTALRDAILQGIELLDHPTSADVVYVLTDGRDTASRQSAAEVSKRLGAAPVRVFAIILYDKYDRDRTPGEITPREFAGPDELSEIARKSGGEILSTAEWFDDRAVLFADSGSKLKTGEILERLYQPMLQDSLLEIELPFPITKNERWELKLSDEARRRWKNAHITYPTMLSGCSDLNSGHN